ncbi:Gfo/Idh/MocA family protein [Zavarzinella formosa]|uniref:Gfo/Idh/MocA family protein n=1 Tax=Zavarzinella formosa TaxID=360055 RepID=UPI0002D3867D|nr:Gfo/Idh/MocA family oxidoreductase [Zavarzinella formosa]
MKDQQRREFLKTVAGGAAAIAPSIAAMAEEKPTKERIKIGQIGVGHAHAAKLSVYRKSADYEVVGLVEPDAALRKRAETQEPFAGLKWLTQEQLLNTPGLQAVLVETHVGSLLTTAEACVMAGKHVHIDKPAGESLPQFKRILDSAKKQKLLVQMGYMFRYNPGVVLLREFLKKGWLGEVFEIHTVMSKVVDPASRRGLAQFPGGIMFELGCHVMDLVIGIMGKPDEVTPFARHTSKLDDKLMDNMLAVLAYPKATATVKASAIEVEGGDRRHLVVCGTEGTFHIQPLDNPSVKVALSQARGEYKKGYQDIRLPKYLRYVDDAADMARIIRGEKSSDFTYEHDLMVQETLLKACGVPVV